MLRRNRRRKNGDPLSNGFLFFLNSGVSFEGEWVGCDGPARDTREVRKSKAGILVANDRGGIFLRSGGLVD